MRTSLVRQHLFKETEYPLRYQRSVLLKTVTVQFCILFLFLWLFKPFGAYTPEHRVSYFSICFVHAFSPALIIYTYFYGLSYVYEHTTMLKRWTLLREYAHLAIVFFLAGLASFLMRSFIYNNPDNWSWRYLGEEIRNCYLAGILFYILLFFAGAYFRSNQEFVTIEKNFIDTVLPNESTAVVNTELFIKTQVQQDDFSFNPADLLYAKADGNYIELTLGINNQIIKQMVFIGFRKVLVLQPPLLTLKPCLIG